MKTQGAEINKLEAQLAQLKVRWYLERQGVCLPAVRQLQQGGVRAACRLTAGLPDSPLFPACPSLPPPQADLAAAESKRTAAEGKLSEAQADAKSAKSELSKLEQKLSSTSSSLETAQSKLTRAERDLLAAKTAAEEAAGAGSSCKLSLKRAESQISEQASRLDELKAVEEALLPVWLSRRCVCHCRVWLRRECCPSSPQACATPTCACEQPSAQCARPQNPVSTHERPVCVTLTLSCLCHRSSPCRLVQAQSFTAEQSQQLWKAVQESDIAARAAESAAPYYDAATAAVGPYWEQAMEVSKPARETGAVYFQKAKVGGAWWLLTEARAFVRWSGYSMCMAGCAHGSDSD